MKAHAPLFPLLVYLFAISTLPQQKAQTAHKSGDDLTPSEHRLGPNGLEGWTLDGPIPDEPKGKYPFTLVIARNGHKIQRFNGDPFVWRWMFVEKGTQVAYESGPLHFGMTCILADIKTGRQIADYDCFNNSPDDAPAWVQNLEALQ